MEHIGTNNDTDMFPARPWTIEWLTNHCRDRFQVVPQPRLLADLWGFDDLVRAGASRILFTNGLMDGWSVGGILSNLTESLVAVNMPNGAHHSDLSHSEPDPATDTEDVTAARAQIGDILASWLSDMP